MSREGTSGRNRKNPTRKANPAPSSVKGERPARPLAITDNPAQPPPGPIPPSQNRQADRDLDRLTRAPINMPGIIQTVGYLTLTKAVALGVTLFSVVGALGGHNWNYPLDLTIYYIGLVVLAMTIFVLVNRPSVSPGLKFAGIVTETLAITASTFMMGRDQTVFFTLLPFYVIVAQMQFSFRTALALPMAFALWLVMFLCLATSNSMAISDSFWMVLILVSIPFVFTTMVTRFAIREGRQRTRLVATLQELQSSEERYRQVTDQANDAIYILDRAGAFTFVNPKMTQVSGYTQEELLGRPFSTLLTPESRPLFEDALRQAEKNKKLPQTLQLKMLCKDGSLRDIELSAALLPGGQVVVARDVTERLRMREETARRNKHLSALNTVVSVAGQSLDMDKILNDMVNTMVEVSGADVAGITILEEESRLLKVAAYRGASDMVVRAVTHSGLKEGEGLTGMVAATGQPMLIADMTSDPRVNLNLVKEVGLRAFAAAPITSRDRIIGVLSLMSHQAGAFKYDDLDLITSVGKSLGVAIDNARLYGMSQNQIRELTCLADIARAINLSQSLGQTLANIAESISTVLDYKGCIVYLVDSSRTHIQAHGSYALPANYIELVNEMLSEWERHPPEEVYGPPQVLHEGKPVVNLTEHMPPLPALDKLRAIAEKNGWNSIVSVPLMAKGTAIGLISCYSGESVPPPESELHLLGTIANQTVVAVTNAGLYREQQKRADQLRAVSSIGQKIGVILNVDELLPYITRLLHQTFDYYNVAVFLKNQSDGNILEARASHGWIEIPVGSKMKDQRGIIAWVAEHGEGLLVPDVENDTHYVAYPKQPPGLVKSELAVPIKVGGNVIGVIDVASTMLGGFDEIDMAALQTLAEQVGIAIENAHLYTELNRIVVQLKSANTELEEATRHKSEFLANMSHELRTPLNAIIGFSEVLQDGLFGDLNAKQNHYVGNILTSGRHLLTLVNDVLDLAKVEAGRMELHLEEFGPNEAVLDVEAIVAGIANKKRLEIKNDFEAKIPKIKADKSKFKQILYNLLSNAVKFTPEGGKITVSTRPEMSAADGSEFAAIAVADTGIGIKKDDQQRIFEEFKQVDSSYSRQYQGTGLGLALSRRLVELHGGDIGVQSEPGVGSVFTFRLPLVCSDEPLPPASDDPIDRLLKADAKTRLQRQIDGGSDLHPVKGVQSSDVYTGNGNQPAPRPLVLIIEDDDRSAELISLYLSAEGYATTRLRGGADLLDQVRTLEPSPALITLDIMLPSKSGWDLLRELKADPDLKEIPVLVVSIIDNASNSRNLGASEWLVKPIVREELLQKVNRIVVKPSTHTTASVPVS